MLFVVTQVIEVLDKMAKPEDEAGDVAMTHAQQDAQLAKQRTIHMFSATMPAAVERLAKKARLTAICIIPSAYIVAYLQYLHGHATVKIGDKDAGGNRNITQEIIVCEQARSWMSRMAVLPNCHFCRCLQARKKTLLTQQLDRGLRPCIIFVNAKKNCDVVARELDAKVHATLN
jgi:superfamily II DNA/RNA helicase